MKLTSEFLCSNLTQTERLYLHAMTLTDGFPVLQRMLDEACRVVTAEVMKCDPTEANYERTLAATQANARSIHEFCGAIRKSILAHIGIAIQNEAKENGNERTGAGN